MLRWRWRDQEETMFLMRGAEILLNPCATPEQGRRDEH